VNLAFLLFNLLHYCSNEREINSLVFSVAWIQRHLKWFLYGIHKHRA